LLIHVTNLPQLAEQAQTVFPEHTGGFAVRMISAPACIREFG